MRVTSTISSKQPAASIYGCPGLRGPIQPLISLWLRSAIRIWAYPASVGSFFTISAATSCVACLLSQSAVPFQLECRISTRFGNCLRMQVSRAVGDSSPIYVLTSAHHCGCLLLSHPEQITVMSKYWQVGRASALL